MKNIRQQIIRVINECNLTPLELSRRSGIPVSTIYNWLHNRSDMTFGKIEKVLHVMDFELVLRSFEAEEEKL